MNAEKERERYARKKEKAIKTIVEKYYSLFYFIVTYLLAKIPA